MQHIISHDSKGRAVGRSKKIQVTPAISRYLPLTSGQLLFMISLDRLIIHTDQPWPSVFSNNTNLIYNSDGSVDAWFGPDAISGKENNWVKTIPGKQWYMISASLLSS